MTKGSITKVVTSFGSTWGRITPLGESSQVFFNLESFAEPANFEDLKEGQEVEFDQEPDRANGTRAVRLVMSAVAASSAVSGQAEALSKS
jgi:cold shock CspA family protein